MPNIDNSTQQSLGKRGYFSERSGLGLMRAVETGMHYAMFVFMNSPASEEFLDFDIVISNYDPDEMTYPDTYIEMFRDYNKIFRRTRHDWKLFNRVDDDNLEDAKRKIDISKDMFFSHVYISHHFNETELKELCQYIKNSDMEVGVSFQSGINFDFLSQRDFLFFENMFYYFDSEQKASSTTYIKEVTDFLGIDGDLPMSFSQKPYNKVGLNTIDYNDANHFLYSKIAYLASLIIGLDGVSITCKNKGLDEGFLYSYKQPYFSKTQRYSHIKDPYREMYNGVNYSKYYLDFPDLDIELIWLSDDTDPNTLGGTSERKVLVNSSEVTDTTDSVLYGPDDEATGGTFPIHQWSGTSLQFQNEDGTWGDLVDLEGPQGIQGIQGEQGIQGYSMQYDWSGTSLGVKTEDEVDYTYADLKGEKGDKPNHQWSGTSLQFENVDGSWGSLVDLKGDQGEQGIQGIQGPRGYSIDYNWSGTSLGVKGEDESTFTYTDLKGEKGDMGEGVNWRGEYDPVASYQEADLVEYNNIVYICKSPTTGNDPTNATYWDTFIALAATTIKREEFTATEGQTLFNLTLGTYARNENKINVYVWGKKQPNAAFDETTTSSITMSAGLSAGDKVLLEWFEGDPSLKGDKGDKGDAATLDLGTVSFLNQAEEGYINNIGTVNDAVFDIGIPKGSLVELNTTPVQTINPDQNPSIVDTGVNGNRNLQFLIPRASNISVGSVTTIDPELSASVTNSGTNGDVVLDFNIPKGKGITDIVDNGDGTITISYGDSLSTVMTLTLTTTAADTTYDNTASGMTATNVQEAIDEIDLLLDNLSADAVDINYDNSTSGLAATNAQAAIDELAAQPSDKLETAHWTIEEDAVTGSLKFIYS